MSSKAVAFTTSGVIGLSGEEETIVGYFADAFTTVEIYHGIDATGVLIASGVGTALLPDVHCGNGLYVAITGTGNGAVFVV